MKISRLNVLMVGYCNMQYNSILLELLKTDITFRLLLQQRKFDECYEYLSNNFLVRNATNTPGEVISDFTKFCYEELKIDVVKFLTIIPSWFGYEEMEVITIPNAVNIKYDAFEYSPNLTQVIIGEGCKRIEESAFYNCTKLTTVVMPKTMAHIGAFSFSYCSGLKTIHYGGTMKQWKDIPKYDQWDDGTNNVIVSCIDGEVTL